MKFEADIRGLMKLRERDTLPYSCPFSAVELRLIECVIGEAIRMLQKEQRIGAQSAEVDITNELQKLLNLMLENDTIPGFSKGVFESVVRGGEIEGAGGAKEKRPDLTFRSARSRPGIAYPDQCVLIVECKVVDQDHPMSRYCGDGLVRFVDGRYAWAVNYAMMLGYARNSYEPDMQLRAHLKSFGSKYRLLDPGLHKRAFVPIPSTPTYYLSRHGRDLRSTTAAHEMSIELAHVWHKID